MRYPSTTVALRDTPAAQCTSTEPAQHSTAQRGQQDTAGQTVQVATVAAERCSRKPSGVVADHNAAQVSPPPLLMPLC
jgi:hypothetical protein